MRRQPLNAVRFALDFHRALAELSEEEGVHLRARVGIHLGEVFLRDNPVADIARGAKPLEVEGFAKVVAARVVSLARGGQTLMTRPGFGISKFLFPYVCRNSRIPKH